MAEQTLVLIKPDAVKRGVAGEIVSRFEKAGLKLVGAKMVHPTRELAEKHYPTTKEWFLKVGKNTLSDCEKYGIDVEANLGTSDPEKIGRKVWEWNLEFLMSGPMFAMVLEGNHAVENVRMMVGTTIPTLAVPGTIRGDYSLESTISANAKGRAVYNLVHASGNHEEAEREIKLWFKPSEIFKYKRLEEYLYGD